MSVIDTSNSFPSDSSAWPVVTDDSEGKVAKKLIGLLKEEMSSSEMLSKGRGKGRGRGRGRGRDRDFLVDYSRVFRSMESGLSSGRLDATEAVKDMKDIVQQSRRRGLKISLNKFDRLYSQAEESIAAEERVSISFVFNLSKRIVNAESTGFITKRTARSITIERQMTSLGIDSAYLMANNYSVSGMSRMAHADAKNDHRAEVTEGLDDVDKKVKEASEQVEINIENLNNILEVLNGHVSALEEKEIEKERQLRDLEEQVRTARAEGRDEYAAELEGRANKVREDIESIDRIITKLKEAILELLKIKEGIEETADELDEINDDIEEISDDLEADDDVDESDIGEIEDVLDDAMDAIEDVEDLLEDAAETLEDASDEIDENDHHDDDIDDMVDDIKGDLNEGAEIMLAFAEAFRVMAQYLRIASYQITLNIISEIITEIEQERMKEEEEEEEEAIEEERIKEERMQLDRLELLRKEALEVKELLAKELFFKNEMSKEEN